MLEPNFTITNQILSRIAEIEACHADVKGAILLPERENELHHRATVENTHSSTSIEGNPLNDRQVSAVLEKRVNPLTRHRYAEIEVRNYKKALDFIDKRKTIKTPITAADILDIHRIVMDGLLPDKKIGHFRTGEIYVVNHKDEVVYTGATAKKLKKELSNLLSWLSSTDAHPVIAAAIFHAIFVSIHPFADGNGRSTRLLTLLYLGLRDFDFRSSLVLDNFYAADKLRYYDELQSVHSDKYDNVASADFTGWLEYFTEGFLSSAEVLRATVKILSISAQPLMSVAKLDRDETDILSYIAEFGSVNLSEAEGILPHLSRRTIQRKFQKLVKNGYLKTIGDSRSTTYTQK